MGLKWKIILLSTVLIFLSNLACAAPQDDLAAALKNGTPDVDVITGFEYKHRDDSTSPGQQFSIRTRLGYRSAEFMHTSAYVQLHNVSNVMEEYRFMHDGKMRGDLDRDIIADPDGSRFQQAYLDFSFIPDTVVRVGRQEIILDDARLIGNIDWRLNGQSFDAASITNTSIPDLKLYAAYVQQVNTILLDDLDLDGMWLFNAGYSGIKNHHLSVYTYLLDTESELDSARDSATYGFRFSGNMAPLSYYLDYTYQSDFADGEDHDADMLNLYLDADLGKFTLGGGYSYISGQDGTDRPFDTLFSTAHKFNGFADQFLGTNGGGLAPGLQDYYLQASTRILGAKLLIAYHYFDTAEDNGFDGTYGDEFDALVVKPVAENLNFIVKYANFMQDDSTASGNPTRDTEILSVRLRYKF
jgi:hypothetical protein